MDHKTVKIKTIDQQVMSILRTVLERCKKEKSSNCLQVPLEDCYERVSFYTAYPKMFIYHIIDDNQYIEEDGFDDHDHITLMTCINLFLSQQRCLRVKDLYYEFLNLSKVKSQPSHNPKHTPDLKIFERKLYTYGYVYKKNLKGPPLVLVENPKLKFDRFNYLFKIKNYREKNRKIYYIDENDILKPQVKKSVTIQETCNPHYHGLIFFHVISADGFEYGIFVTPEKDKSLEEVFKKWMIDIVLSSIMPNSVIVMANNFLHGLLPKKSITRYHSKKKMLQFLRENNIPCDPSMNKPRLFELIEKCTINNLDYDIDRIFKLQGHDVLRLPTTFSSLTPTKLLWEYVVQNFNLYDPCMCKFKDNILRCVSDLQKYVWWQFIDTIKHMEDDIFKIDLKTEELLENDYELDEKSFYEDSTHFNIEDILEE